PTEIYPLYLHDALPILEEAADSASKGLSKANKASESDDDSDDEDDDLPVIESQRWHAAATESPIPRLKSGIVLMSFRPKSQPERSEEHTSELQSRFDLV